MVRVFFLFLFDFSYICVRVGTSRPHPIDILFIIDTIIAILYEQLLEKKKGVSRCSRYKICEWKSTVIFLQLTKPVYVFNCWTNHTWIWIYIMLRLKYAQGWQNGVRFLGGEKLRRKSNHLLRFHSANSNMSSRRFILNVTMSCGVYKINVDFNENLLLALSRSLACDTSVHRHTIDGKIRLWWTA